MVDTLDPLVLDLVEWIAKAPRPYAEVIETWRTSCPPARGTGSWPRCPTRVCSGASAAASAGTDARS